MAMTKKEKETLEAALTTAALRATANVLPDVMPPVFSEALSKGWIGVASCSDYPRVEEACSSSVYHGIGRQDKTSSQGSQQLYSTKLLALKALRWEVEMDSAKRLRRVDRMIEQESSNAE